MPATDSDLPPPGRQASEPHTQPLLHMDAHIRSHSRLRGEDGSKTKDSSLGLSYHFKAVITDKRGANDVVSNATEDGSGDGAFKLGFVLPF